MLFVCLVRTTCSYCFFARRLFIFYILLIGTSPIFRFFIVFYENRKINTDTLYLPVYDVLYPVSTNLNFFLVLFDSLFQLRVNVFYPAANDLIIKIILQ